MKAKSTTNWSVIWVGLEKFGQSAIQLVTLIFLARLLEPGDFGLVAIAFFGVSISKVLMEAGLGSALIHKKEASRKDYSTIFLYNLGVALSLYIILFIAAPFIADFYKEISLTNIIRVLSLVLLFNAFSITQRTHLQKELAFKSLLKLSTLATIIAASCAIAYAYFYPTPYAIVTNYLVFAIVFWLLLVNKVRFKPLFVFDQESFKSMFGYGTQLLGSNLIVSFYNEFVLLLIGKFYPMHIAGIVSQGRKLADYQMSIYRGLYDGAGFPILSKNRGSDNFVPILRNLQKLIYFIAIPIIVFCFFYTEKIIAVLLGEQWLEASYVLRVLSVGVFFLLIESGAKNVLKAIGKTMVIFKIESYVKVFGIIVISLAILHSWQMVILAYAGVQIAGGLIGFYILYKFLNHPIIQQFFDFLPYLGLAILSGLITYPLQAWIQAISENQIVQFVTIGSLFVCLYLLATWILKLMPIPGTSSSAEG